MMHLRLLAAAAALMIATAAPAAPDAPESARAAAAATRQKALPPDELARRTADELLARINANLETYRADKNKLFAMVDEVVLKHFDFNYMAKLVLARNWLSASSDQRGRFEGAFKNLLIRTYATALLEYSNETVEWLPMEAESGAEKVVVRSRVQAQGAAPVPIDYRMHLRDGSWKVYDISVDNISLVTNYRGTYNAEIKKDGIDALIARMEQRAGP